MAKVGPINSKQKHKKCSWSWLWQKKGIILRRLLNIFSFGKKTDPTLHKGNKIKTDQPWLARVDRYTELHNWFQDRYVTHEKGSCRFGGNFAIKGVIKELKHKKQTNKKNHPTKKPYETLPLESRLWNGMLQNCAMHGQEVCTYRRYTKRGVVKMWFWQDKKWTQVFVCLCVHRWSWGSSPALEYLVEAKQHPAHPSMPAFCKPKDLHSDKREQQSCPRPNILSLAFTACCHSSGTRGHCMVCTLYMMDYIQWHWQALVAVHCPGWWPGRTHSGLLFTFLFKGLLGTSHNTEFGLWNCWLFNCRIS